MENLTDKEVAAHNKTAIMGVLSAQGITHAFSTLVLSTQDALPV